MSKIDLTLAQRWMGQETNHSPEMHAAQTPPPNLPAQEFDPSSSNKSM